MTSERPLVLIEQRVEIIVFPVPEIRTAGVQMRPGSRGGVGLPVTLRGSNLHGVQSALGLLLESFGNCSLRLGFGAAPLGIHGIHIGPACLRFSNTLRRLRRVSVIARLGSRAIRPDREQG